MNEAIMALMGVIFIVLLFTEPCTAVGILLAAAVVARVLKD